MPENTEPNNPEYGHFSRSACFGRYLESPDLQILLLQFSSYNSFIRNLKYKLLAEINVFMLTWSLSFV